MALTVIVATGCSDRYAGRMHPSELAQLQTASGEESGMGFAGQFLVSHFAQSQHDWETATDYLDRVLLHDPENTDLLKRSMILAMGTGDLPKAVARAKSLLDIDEANGLVTIVLVIDALAADKITVAMEYLENSQEEDILDYIGPLIKSWMEAGQGNLALDDIGAGLMRLYNGALIALYLDKKDEALVLARKMLSAGNIAPWDAERAADLLVVLGKVEDALALYKGVYAQNSGNSRLEDKIQALQRKDVAKLEELLQPLQIEGPVQGVSRVMFDMARLFYQERSDSNTKIFVHMSLVLAPDFVDAKLLLANTLARNGRLDEAIAYFSSVSEDHETYLQIQRYIAELMDKAGRRDEAMTLLNRLFLDYNDVEALILTGDMHRQEKDYGRALTAYNRAVKHIGQKEVPEKFWYLLYARGMTYEQEGKWGKAESDLKAALIYRPNHPYLLNYLGYGWADQGMHLDKSLELIQQAVALRPTDGYITDSLGWVLFMMGRYDEALPHLERAAELLPYDTTINDHLGDVYWQVGRQLEARYQWERAINSTEEEEQQAAIRDKLHNGLQHVPLKEASSQVENGAP